MYFISCRNLLPQQPTTCNGQTLPTLSSGRALSKYGYSLKPQVLCIWVGSGYFRPGFGFTVLTFFGHTQCPMAIPAATASAKSLINKLLFHSPPKTSPFRYPISAITTAAYSTLRNKRKSETKQTHKYKRKNELIVKRRTRSDRELDEDGFSEQYGNDNSAHVPVMLGEVTDVFASVALKSFVDCTLGAGGHSAAVG